ncbi:MAG TPA: hypothetical protein VFP44_05545 [Usitatibacter sp.]|nr:hypothetical protein [Usitatibacter sp.]
MLRRIRKSGRVTLVLIGVAAAGCGGDDTRRDVYKSRDDCLADWGNKPEDCQPATDQRHRSSGYFYGPAYVYHSGGSGATWTGGAHSRAIGSTSSSVSRGGFGSSARSAGG